MSGAVLTLPDLGEGLTEAEIVEWRVAVGDRVVVDQVVVVVETAKAAVEVPVPFDGSVVALHAQPGEVIAVGRPLLSVGAAEPAADDEISGKVLVGYGTSRPTGTRRRRVAAGPSRAAPQVAPPAPAAERAGPLVAPPAPKVVSPLVRRHAAEHDIDVATLVPSGRGGVVLRRDIDAAIEDRSAGPAPTVELETRIPLQGMRGATAAKMVTSRTEIPEVTTWVDADATELVAVRDALRTAGRQVSTLALLGRICVAGLARYPDLNASVDTVRRQIVQRKDVHLGVAVQTPRGLVVPVIHDAEALSATELADAMARLTAKARDGKLAPADVRGGTITLNNYGVFGVDGSTPIINHPEAALVGVGRIAAKPWVHDGAVAVRKVVQLSLTFDHRVCDGAVAGGYLRWVADAVEQPVLLLADL
jgi:2-oxoisovalerate dehydrogenase E2 component (dihydrolipoyl transacylase)